MGSCILRKAIQLCQDSNLKVIFPLHDALYIEYNSDDTGAVPLFKMCMRDAFTHFFHKKKKASMIRLDVFKWGPDCENKLYIDERSKEDYERFSKYF